MPEGATPEGATPEGATPGGAIPGFAIDPFSEAFLENPHPFQRELRDLGLVVRLGAIGTLAVARHAEVRAVPEDWATSSSARGVGLDDFAKTTPWRLPSLVLETDPPLHDRTRRVQGRVLSPAAIGVLRQPFAEAAESLVGELLDRREFDAVPDLAEAYPLAVFPDAVGMPRENRRFLLPHGNMVFRANPP